MRVAPEAYPSAEPHLPIPFALSSFWECKFPFAARSALPGKFKNSLMLLAPVAFPKRHSCGNKASPGVCFHCTSKRLGSGGQIPARNPRAFWSVSSLLAPLPGTIANDLTRIRPADAAPLPIHCGPASL
jgi:hypothetical protein